MRYLFVPKSNSPTVTVRKPGELALTGINQLTSNLVVKQTIVQRLEHLYDLKPTKNILAAIRLVSHQHAKSWEMAAGVHDLPFNVYVSELYLAQEKAIEPLLTPLEWDNYSKNLLKIYYGQGLSKQFINHSFSNKKRVTKEWIYSRNWKGFWSFRVKIDEEGEAKRKELAKAGKVKESQLYRTNTMVCIYKMHLNPKLLQLAVIGKHDEMYLDINPSRLAYSMLINQED